MRKRTCSRGRRCWDPAWCSLWCRRLCSNSWGPWLLACSTGPGGFFLTFFKTWSCGNSPTCHDLEPIYTLCGGEGGGDHRPTTGSSPARWESIFISFLIIMRQVRDLVVGEEPGEGGEGGHHPLEGDHRLLHVPVQEEDRGAGETEYLNCNKYFFLFGKGLDFCDVFQDCKMNQRLTNVYFNLYFHSVSLSGLLIIF